MDAPGFFEFCKANASSGVLLIALALFARWIGPRLDKLIDHFIAQSKENAIAKPQLDRIEANQKQNGDVCRFKDPASAAAGTA